MRSRYLFALANVCHVGPSQVSDLTVPDFAQLVHGINAEQAAAEKQKPGMPAGRR